MPCSSMPLIDAWERCAGVKPWHAIYGSVTLRPGALQEQSLEKAAQSNISQLQNARKVT